MVQTTMNNQQRFIRLAVLGVIGVFILIAANTVYSSIKHRNLTKLVIHTSIPGTQVSLDGQTVRGSTQYVKPGDYKLKATKEGFDAHLANVIVNNGGAIDVYLPLNASSADAKQYLKDHPKINTQNNLLYQTKEDVDLNMAQQSYPFLKSLPLESAYYSVGYSSSQKYPDDPSKIAITIRATSAYGRNWALDDLSKIGVDTTKQEIIFLDFNNPFLSTGAQQ